MSQSPAEIQSLLIAIQQLNTIRHGTLRVQDLLASISNAQSKQDLADVLQGMSSSLSSLTSSWSQVSTAVQKSQLPPGSQADKDAGPAISSQALARPVEVFEEILTAHMIAASAAVIKRQCIDPSHSQQSWTAAMQMDMLPPGLAPQQAGSHPKHSQHAAELSAIIERVRSAAPGVMLYACNAHGSVHLGTKDAWELKLAYPNVFCASIALSGPGRPEVLRIMVDSYDKAHDLDAWVSSSHQVFRRMSSLAMRALSYFQKRAACWQVEGPAQARAPGCTADVKEEPVAAAAGQPGSARDVAAGSQPVTSLQGTVLEQLLLWLTTYRDMFTRPCCVTGKLLTWDPSTQYPLPPIFRDFKCSVRRLRVLASDASLIRAYHMHVVPEDMLDWCYN